MNGVQRVILVIAAIALFMLAALGAMDASDHYDGSGWLPLTEFLVSIGCFVLAAQRRAA